MRKSEVEIKLLDELRSRGHRLMLPHCIVLTLTMFLFWDHHKQNLTTLFPYLLVYLSLCGRFAMMKWFYQSYKSGNILVGQFFNLLVMTTGLGWGILFLNMESSFGLLSVQTLYCMGAILTLMSGTITVFSADMKLAALFLVSLSVLPLWHFFHLNTSFSLLGYVFLGNAFYQFQHTKMTNKYLRETLKNEMSAIEQKNILQDYIDAIPGIVGLIDTDLTYVMVNNYQNGLVKSKILGTKVGATIKNNPVSTMIIEFMKSSETEMVREVYAKDLTGDNWYMVNLKKISSPQKGVIAAVLPINDLVKAKSDLKIQEARTQYAAKLASLGEFSAGIAHEVSNPLTIIEGAAGQLKDLMKEEVLDVSTINRIVYKISETTQRIGRIIKSLRTLAKDAEEEPFRNLTFISIVEPAREITKMKLDEYGIELRIFNSEEDVALFGNEIQLSQVILNLISNSIDAVKDLPQRWIEIHYRPSYEWSDILVIDSGRGVPEEISEKIMDAFFTTKESHHGTGLGLSISKNIIERHFGSLSVEKSAKHTTFRIQLPRMNMWQPKKMNLV